MEIRPGERLRALRDKSQLSMAKLAAKVQPPASASQINKLEKGEVEFTIDWAKRLGEALAVPYLEFFGAIPKLEPGEENLVELYRGLAEGDRDTVFKVAAAISQAKRSQTR